MLGGSATVEVTRLSAQHEPAYTRFVAGHPDAVISYTLAYRDLLLELLGCQARYAVALHDGAVVGAMPLMSLGGPLGTVVNSLPYFGSSGAPLTRDRQAREALCAWYADETSRDGVVAGTVIANPLAADGGGLVHDLVDTRIAHVTRLAGEGEPRERIWAAIDGSARRNVSKARRCGAEVTVENDAFAELEALHRSSMTAIGAKVKGPDFFAAIRRHFRPTVDYDLFVARIERAAVAALLVFYCATTVDYYIPAVSPDHRSEQPLAVILLEAMARAAERGLARWNWGGSWPTHASLQRFKAKWGGAPRAYGYATKLNDRGLLRTPEAEILAGYPGFFVVPFSQLETA